ncbi:MAG TPA: hypothetical protein PLN21_00585 [Gemmatales bacterium]|nr:hypothetical protein [Gemmatales bacterium]
MIIASVILLLIGLYLGVGLLFGLTFITWGLERLDHACKGTSWLFRFLLLPGSIALWPWLAHRWMQMKDVTS